MGRLAAAILALAILAIVPAAGGQLPTLPRAPGDVLGPTLDRAAPAAIAPTENETGEDLHTEDVRVDMRVSLINVEYQLVGILFGGGKVAADATVDAHLEFRAVSTKRLDEAIRATSGDANASLQGTFGFPSNRTAVTAEEVRVIGGGALLAAFQAYQAEETKRLVEATLPELVLLSTTLDWTNTAPAHGLREYEPPEAPPTDLAEAADAAPETDLREPPLTLDLHARLNFLSRVSLGEILQEEAAKAGSDDETPAERLKRSLRENETAGLLDRTAFNALGITQLLAFGIPPGWRVTLTLSVPAGYTVEGVTDELILAADHRGIGYALDGGARETAAERAGLVTVSNRFLVTATALALVALAGTALRLPVEMAAIAFAAREPREPRSGWLKFGRRRG